MKKQTKAERIFKSTLYESLRHIKRMGYTKDSSWNRMITEETIYLRTVNDMEREADRQERRIADWEKFHICPPEEITINRQALEMVRNTLANTRDELEAYEDYKKGRIDFDTYLATL